MSCSVVTSCAVRRVRRAGADAAVSSRFCGLAVGVLLAAITSGAGPQAQALGVATWNLQWLLDADTHARWTGACGSMGWPTSADALTPAARSVLAGFPYCNVHNGMAFPPDRCRTLRDGWPNAARYPDDHPCRDTADLAAWPRYAEKLAALRTMFRRLDDLGVRLVAVQEVAGAAAVEAILPPGWSVITTRDLPGTPAITQHVGVAWRRGVSVRNFEAVNALADGGIPDRPLRPGLAFTVDVAGRPVRVLVVHLKAGCRSRDLDVPLTEKDAQLSPERKDIVTSDCATLRYQLPALEDWIDANATRDFAVMGDFNRTLLREPPFDSATYRTRLDGSTPGDPQGPCTLSRDVGRWVAHCRARTRAMFPELNDGVPAGAVLWRARFADLASGGTIHRGSTGDCSIRGRRGDLTHDGIDHVLISESLKRRLAPDALVMRVVNYTEVDGSPLRARPDRALPSDHCPHVVHWSAP
jgi:endonuclease/exonuclease/phosphatase family metal-dependent hydrolase